ncbi:hypothetical protein HDU88_007863 [Geranomyces variabilis]|nr:hypothetical protein HDU88_007863 [Geranomyces variabilis]
MNAMSTRVHVWRIRHEQWPYPLEYHDTREAPAPKWGLLQGVQECTWSFLDAVATATIMEQNPAVSDWKKLIAEFHNFAASKGQDMEGYSRDGRPGFRAPPHGGNPCMVRSYLGVRWVVTDDESNSPGIWDSLTPQNEATRRPRVMAFAFLDFHMETGVVVTNSAISRSDKEAGRSPIYEVLKQALEDHDKMAAAADASDARLVPARPKWLHMASHHFKNTRSKNQHEPLFKRLEEMPPDVTPWAAHIRASGTRPASTMCVENFIGKVDDILEQHYEQNSAKLWEVGNEASCQHHDIRQNSAQQWNVNGANSSIVPSQLRKRANVDYHTTQMLDGTHNNLDNPNFDSTNGQYYIRKNHPAMFGTGATCEPGGQSRPNARLVSSQALAGGPYKYTDQGHTDFLSAWGLCIHLDVTGPMRNSSDTFNIPIPLGDSVFDPTASGTLFIPLDRAQYARIVTDPITGQPDRLYTNGFTAFIDGSGLYGQGDPTAYDPRSYSNGELAWETRPVLGETPPYDPVAREFRWVWGPISLVPHLTVPYLLLFREHNRRARLIRVAHPDWNDEQIYQKARRMVIATIQHITLNFYYPMRLGNAPDAYTGYNSSVNTAIDLAFNNVAFRYGHNALNSLVERYDSHGQVSKDGPLVLDEVFFQEETPVLLNGGIESIIRGFATQPEQNVDGHYVPVVRNKMPIEHPYYDLVAIDIQRGREMGMADYSTLRVAYGLSAVTSWDDVCSDKSLVAQLKRLYPNLSDVDAYVGAVVEDHVGSSTLGPLSTAIMSEQLLRVRDGDRFWYENQGVLTADELLEIKINGTLGMLVKQNTNITVFPDNPFSVATPDYVLGAPVVKLSDAATESVIVPGIMKLSWSINGDQIYFTVETDASGWVGFGFGANMLPADIYLFRHDTAAGTWTCQDSWSKDLEVPKPDTAYGGTLSVTDFATSSSLTYAHKMTFSRALDTGDPYDVAITKDAMQMIFATGGTVSPSYHGVMNRQHATVNFYTGMSTLASQTTGLYRLNVFHGITMFAGFGFIYPSGIYIARYWKDGGSWVFYHQLLMGAVTTEIVFAALLGIIGGFGPINAPHSVLGLILTALVLIVTLLGRFSGNWDLAFTVKHSRKIRLAHWTLGYTAYSTGLVQGYLGVQDISEGSSVAWFKWLYIPSVLIAPSTLLLIAWRNNYVARKHLASGKNTCKVTDSLPKFDWDELHDRVENGAKLVVVRHIVYDVASFIPKHPGGAKILASVIGMDATAAFYGKRRKIKMQDSHEAAVPIFHAHSRLAENLLSKLAIAALEHNTGDNDEDALPDDDGIKQSNVLDPSDLESVSDVSNRRLHAQKQLKAISRDHLDGEVYKPKPLTNCNLNERVFQNYEVADRFISTRTTSARRTYRISLKLQSAVSTAAVSKTGTAGNKIAQAAPAMTATPEVFVLPGSCIVLQFITDDGEVVTRQYTPYKSRNKQTLDLYVKMANGLMTNHLQECKSIRIRGPVVHAPEALNPRRKTGCWDAIGMISGGSGLTPMLLLIDYHIRFAPRAVSGATPATKMALLNINHSEADVFAREDIENLERKAGGALVVTHLFHHQDRAGAHMGQVGRVSADLVRKIMPFSPGTADPTPLANASTVAGEKIARLQTLQMAAGSEGSKSFTRKRSGSADGGGGFASMSTSRSGLVQQHRTSLKQTSAAYAELSQSVSSQFIVMPDSPTAAFERRQSAVKRPSARAKMLVAATDSDESGEDFDETGHKKAVAIFVCGPPPMQAAVLEILLSIGYDPNWWARCFAFFKIIETTI